MNPDIAAFSRFVRFATLYDSFSLSISLTLLKPLFFLLLVLQTGSLILPLWDQLLISFISPLYSYPYNLPANNGNGSPRALAAIASGKELLHSRTRVASTKTICFCIAWSSRWEDQDKCTSFELSWFNPAANGSAAERDISPQPRPFSRFRDNGIHQ